MLSADALLAVLYHVYVSVVDDPFTPSSSFACAVNGVVGVFCLYCIDCAGCLVSVGLITAAAYTNGVLIVLVAAS